MARDVLARLQLTTLPSAPQPVHRANYPASIHHLLSLTFIVCQRLPAGNETEGIVYDNTVYKPTGLGYQRISGVARSILGGLHHDYRPEEKVA
jgi:hypothetical protein